MRCRRGSIATLFALLAVVICGLAALGSEVGTWYVIKRDAQNAADAAALAGAVQLAQANALTLAGISAGQIANAGTSAVSFANQNGFCTNGATSCMSQGSPQTVAVTVGSYSGGTFSPNTPGSGNPAVQVVITQTQPGIFAALFGQSSISIQASAVARTLPEVCMLALSGQLDFDDSVSMSAPGCLLATNDTAGDAISFDPGSSASVAGMTTPGSCSGSTASCAVATANAPAVSDPLALLGASATIIQMQALTACLTTSGKPVDYGTQNCQNKNPTFASGTYNGTYILSGAVNVQSGAVLTGSATFILLPNTSVNWNGSATLNVSAPNPVQSSELPSFIPAGVMDGVVLIDLTSASLLPMITNGVYGLTMNGAIYAPNAQYNVYVSPTSGLTCGVVIAKSFEFAASASYSSARFSTCPPNVLPLVQAAQLVQ
ncbi:pilus assembly protein TadG-related protein [Rhodopila globiformis]|uniref:Uncharacterized protein n=1 Tax=Rhodopila globiformis TaxID=1071 RepID=A0A2S6MW09_RHOGL|nr:pilus assembly protein TadG-related protein [Rhodopila globiformis]PPQ26553.1 hypothetical protein CCS01_29810 [Rhodopila globiformis]